MRTGILIAICTLWVVPVFSGCSQSTGDFGRPEQGVLRDKILPEFGKILARGRKEPNSRFLYTDEEQEFRRLAANVIRPAHSGDWIAGTLTELQRLRILPEIDNRLDPQGYQKALLNDPFRSSDSRYKRIISDIAIDMANLSAFYRMARRLDQIDRERLRKTRLRADLRPYELQSVYDRVEENRRLMHWGWRAAQFRLAAYRSAIDRLEIETPSRLVGEVNQRWFQLANKISEADSAWQHPATLTQV